MDDVGVNGASFDWLAGCARRDASKARILEVTALLIAERGAANVTVDDIGRRAGCSRATLYRHIGGRPAIFAALVQQRNIAVIAAVGRATTTLTGEQLFLETIICTVNTIRADPVLFDALKHVDREQMSKYLAAPASIASTKLNEPPCPPEDHIAAQLMARIIWSLLDYPLADPVEERAVAQRLAKALHPS